MSYTLHCGDALQVLRMLPEHSVQCCVTSPPYFGLRSYLAVDHPDKALEIGAEDTPDAYVTRLVDVFREVKRALHPSGTLWVNLGDSYNGSGGAGGDYGVGGLKEGQPKYLGRRVDGLKPKDLIGIPWMLAFALRADGWYLRSEIIWAKKAPMPESVTDRPTKAHEQVFLLSKTATYYYDADAIREPYTEAQGGRVIGRGVHGSSQARGNDLSNVGGYPQSHGGRNKRSVWTLGPEPSHLAHFAVMPTKLVEPCVLAGSSAYGCCAKCKAPWARVVERERTPITELPNGHSQRRPNNAARYSGVSMRNDANDMRSVATSTTTGWAATCLCNADVIPCTVLDPFFGSGTVAAVALKHGRHFIGIDLDARNLELARTRIEQMQPMLLAATA